MIRVDDSPITYNGTQRQMVRVFDPECKMKDEAKAQAIIDFNKDRKLKAEKAITPYKHKSSLDYWINFEQEFRYDLLVNKVNSKSMKTIELSESEAELLRVLVNDFKNEINNSDNKNQKEVQNMMLNSKSILCKLNGKELESPKVEPYYIGHDTLSDFAAKYRDLMSNRLFYKLSRCYMTTIRTLTRDELKSFRNFGEKTLNEFDAINQQFKLIPHLL